MNRRISALFILWLLISFAPLIAGCDSEASQTRDDSADLDPTPVDTMVVSSTDFVDTFEVMGTTEPIDVIDVASDVPGEIKEAYVEEGDLVRQGDPLFRIDTEADEAGQDALETQVTAAERELDRLERLRDEGLATEQQVDNARTELDSARDNLRQSQVTIGRSTLRSPIDGRVATRMADGGEFANTGTPLVEIVDYDTIVIYAQVPESELRYVDVDEDTELNVDIPALDDTWTASVDRVALRPTESTRTYTAELHIDNADLAIRPGMRARTHFQRHHYQDAIVIPRDSILEGYDGREVMVISGDGDVGNAETRSIETGPGSRDDIVVLSGLDVGERLILRGHRGLLGDARVEVIDEIRQDDLEDDT